MGSEGLGTGFRCFSRMLEIRCVVRLLNADQTYTKTACPCALFGMYCISHLATAWMPGCMNKCAAGSINVVTQLLEASPHGSSGRPVVSASCKKPCRPCSVLDVKETLHSVHTSAEGQNGQNCEFLAHEKRFWLEVRAHVFNGVGHNIITTAPLSSADSSRIHIRIVGSIQCAPGE